MKEKGYINSIPESQSERDDFNIKLVKVNGENDISKEELYVLSKDTVFYPKNGELPEGFEKNEEPNILED